MGVTRRTLYNWIRNGEIEARKDGTAWWVRVPEEWDGTTGLDEQGDERERGEKDRERAHGAGPGREPGRGTDLSSSTLPYEREGEGVKRPVESDWGEIRPPDGPLALAEKVSPPPLERVTCAAATRKAILDAYPAAKGDPVFLRALVVLLYGTRCDRGSKRLRIDRATLEWINGRRFRGSRWGRDVLAEIRRHLPGFEHTAWLKGDHTRLVKASGIDPALVAVVDADLKTPVSSLVDRVDVLTGRSYGKRQVSAAIEDGRKRATASHRPAPSKTAWAIRDEMNDRAACPPHAFTKPAERATARMLERIDRMSIRHHATLDPTSGHASDDEVRRMYRRVVRAIADCPQPFYLFSARGRTDRVFPESEGLLNLPRDLRMIWNEESGWEELDLSAAHLGIAAALWGVERVRAFLEGGGNAWDEIIRCLGLDHLSDHRRDDVKAVVKLATYAVVYGGPVASVKGFVSRELRGALGEGAGERFTSTWLIHDLVDARGLAYKRLREYDPTPPPSGISAALEGNVEPESAMATIAQSYEAAIMMPAIEYAKEHRAARARYGQQPDFRIVLWQHDGFSVKWRRSESRPDGSVHYPDRAKHLREIQRRVEDRAAHLRVPTRLVTK